MWLSISRDNEISSFWNTKEDKITVEVFKDLNEKLLDNNNFKRLSQIFELGKNNDILPNFKNKAYIRFFFFLSPMKTLGQLLKLLDKEDATVYFGFGLCSIIIIANKSENIDNLVKQLTELYISYEEWEIENNTIIDSKIHPFDAQEKHSIKINDFSTLPKSTRSIFEELHLLLNIFSSKVSLIPKSDLFNINKITREINSLIRHIIIYQEIINSEEHKIPDLDEIDFSCREEVKKLEQKIDQESKTFIIRINMWIELSN
jgi:hypothetical protein